MLLEACSQGYAYGCGWGLVSVLGQEGNERVRARGIAVQEMKGLGLEALQSRK